MNQKSIKSNFFTLIIALFFTLTAAAIWVQAQQTFTVTGTDDRNNPTCAAGDCSSLNSFLALGASSQKNDTALTNAPEAAVITVSTTNDVVDAGTCGSLTVAGLTASAGPDGKISLREAVCATNNTAGADTITLPNGTYLLTLTGINEDAAATGDLDITDNLTINGVGMNTTIIDGNSTDRVFQVSSGGNLTLNGLTVTNGNPLSTLYGGGIYNIGGTLTVTDSIIRGNTANFYGGGIYNYGTAMLTNTTVGGTNTASSGGGIYNEEDSTLTLTNSIVSGNTASESGGGIEAYVDSTTTLINSTVNGNTATNTFGGGIYNVDGTLTITNSTISGNTAGVNGGGIYNDGTSTLTLNLTSVTVAYNTASNLGGGVYNRSGTANLLNTIVAKNTGSASVPDYGGAIASTSKFNLIGNGSGMSGITTGTNGNQVGTSGMPIDPMLDSTLALNGGTTPNHALLAGSPAIDKGSDTSGTDQRGFTRPVDLPDTTYPNATATGANAADIGAFELQAAPTAATVSISGQVTTPSGRGITGVRLSLTDAEGNVRTTTTTSFGYYQFDDVQTGETYILSAAEKHFTFNQPVQVLRINEENDQVNFIANSEKRLRVF